MAYYDTMDSPVGPLFIGGTAEGLSRIDFLASEGDSVASIEPG